MQYSALMDRFNVVKYSVVSWMHQPQIKDVTIIDWSSEQSLYGCQIQSRESRRKLLHSQ